MGACGIICRNPLAIKVVNKVSGLATKFYNDPVQSTWSAVDWFLFTPDMRHPEELMIHFLVWYTIIPWMFATLLHSSMSYAFLASFIFNQIMARLGKNLEEDFFPHLKRSRNTDSWSKVLLYLVQSAFSKVGVSVAKKND